jgi:co-chaperonin GroES (HSP10)
MITAAKETSLIILLLSLSAIPWMSSVSAMAVPTKAQNKYGGGAGVGRFVMDEWIALPAATQCHYDMVLVERIQKRNTAAEFLAVEGDSSATTTLYVPDNDLPKLHLCRVISIGPGKEEENGLIVSTGNVNVGDLVIAKNPWGIGPKDEETPSGKKLSFMRFQDIAAVISGGSGLLE